MTLNAIELITQPAHRSFRLTRSTDAAGVTRQVRPSIVLPDREARALLAAAAREDVSATGCYSAGPAGVQVWSGPWNGLLGSRGSAVHLGSVDWSYDTPSRHYITIYRVLVTAKGETAGETPEGVLARVLALAGVNAEGTALDLPVPPARDPFRAALRQQSIQLPD